MILVDHPLSPYAQKVRLVLAEKGIEYESREMWSQSQHAELLLLSPRGEVPALIDGDAVIADSTIICEYLEDRFPDPPLMPTEPAARAKARSIERLADTSVDACVLAVALFAIFRPALAQERPAELERAKANVVGHYDFLEAQLGDSEYLAGELSRADLAMVVHVSTASFLGCAPGDDHPRLVAWLERMSARPSIVNCTAQMMAAVEKGPTVEKPLFENDRLHWRDCRIEWLLRCGLGDWLTDELAGETAFFSPIPQP